MFNLFNFIAYQLAWFAVILGAANGHAWAGAMVALLVAAIHVWRRPEAFELKLMGAALAVGLLVDTTLLVTGQIRFDASWTLPVAPYWMLSLWIAFATTLNHSLRWLMVRPASAALLGALGGPLAYLAGARLGALSLRAPAMSLALIAALWAPAMAVLSFMVARGAALPQARKVPA